MTLENGAINDRFLWCQDFSFRSLLYFEVAELHGVRL